MWDGDLQERNSPLPRWWLILFFLSMAFCFVYLPLYPGLGRFRGVLGWSKESQYAQEMAAAKAKYDPIYASFAGHEIVDLARDPRAVALGRSLFLNNCTACHGSDARGAVGFPNLTDKDWLYGGKPETIVKPSPTGGRASCPRSVRCSAIRASGGSLLRALAERPGGSGRSGGGREGALRTLRGLPRPGRQRQPGHRCAQPDR